MRHKLVCILKLSASANKTITLIMAQPTQTRSTYADVDRVIHEPARLILLTTLFVLKKADFVRLATRTGLSGGNLSSHLTRLENAEYVTISKSFVNNRPHTLVELTTRGRTALWHYRGVMASILGLGE